jgi:hypothetical protein
MHRDNNFKRCIQTRRTTLGPWPGKSRCAQNVGLVAVGLGQIGSNAMAATQIVMDYTGDTRHHFDANDREAVARAEERFRKLTGAGFTAAVRTATGDAALTRSFDPTAEETLFFPRLIGG